MKKFFIGVLCVAGVAYMLGLGVLVIQKQPQIESPLGDVNGVPYITPDVASTTSVIVASSKQVMATSTSAQYRMFQNNSPYTIYLAFTNDKTAAVNAGVMLLASSTIELRNESLYQGAVTAISLGGQATLLMIQK